jgi:hypothetical protein
VRLRGALVEFGYVISRIKAVSDSEGEVFLSYIDTEYYLHGWPLDVAVLLDAAQPGQVLGPVPGAQPVLCPQICPELGRNHVPESRD